MLQTVLEETLNETKNNGSYGAIVDSVEKSRSRNNEKCAIGYVTIVLTNHTTSVSITT